MSAHAPGWFGKLSFLGDFASRRLPQGWVQACDQWLSQCLAGSQRQLGEQFLPAYLNAPVWRFACGPQVMDEHWWFGVLMSSCDNVGRYFPLVVAQSRPQPPADRFALDHLELWWQHAAEAALATLGDDASLERFEAELHDAPRWPGALPLAADADALAGGRHALVPGSTLAELARALASAGLRQQLVGRSLWWPWRAGEVAGSYRVVDGLPGPALFTEMLGG